jgi:hypothetical protein
MNPLRGGFPDGGGLKIKRRARSLSVCVLEVGGFVGRSAGEVGAVDFEAPGGSPGALLPVEAGGGVETPDWLVDWLVGSGVGVESMSLMNDYNSNLSCGCNLYANQLGGSPARE